MKQGLKMEEQLGNWINFNRNILSKYWNKEINRNEYFLYLHLRNCCDPYGKCKTSINDIRSEVFGNKVGKNYVNKILLSLKSKKLIWFKGRQGVRGSFEVHFGDFIVPGGKIKTLDKYFSDTYVRSNSSSLEPEESEATPEAKAFSQKFQEDKKGLIEKFSMDTFRDKVRGNHNDNKNNNNIIDV